MHTQLDDTEARVIGCLIEKDGVHSMQFRELSYPIIVRFWGLFTAESG